MVHIYAADYGRFPPNYRDVFGQTGFHHVLYLRGSGATYDLRRILGGHGNYSGSNATGGNMWGNAKIWACPGPAPTKLPYAEADRTGGYTSYGGTNYELLFSDPWNGELRGGSPVNNMFVPVSPATLPTQFKAAKSLQRDPADVPIVQDAVMSYVGTDATIIPGPGFGVANHVRSPSATVLPRWGTTGRENVSMFVYDVALINEQVPGKNTLYSGGQVEWNKLSDLVAMERLSVRSYIDVPAWQRGE